MPFIRARPKAAHGYCCVSSSILEAREEWGRIPNGQAYLRLKKRLPLILGGEIRKSRLSLSRKKRNLYLLFGRQFWRYAPIALVDELHDDLANRSTAGRPVDFTPSRTIRKLDFDHGGSKHALAMDISAGRKVTLATSRIRSSPSNLGWPTH
jgi:hypothetical protein